MQPDDPRQQNCRKPLAADCFEIGEAAGDWVHRQDIAEATGRERAEAEIGQRLAELERISGQMGERVRHELHQHDIQADKDHADAQIHDDRPEYAVISRAAAAEDGSRDDPQQSELGQHLSCGAHGVGDQVRPLMTPDRPRYGQRHREDHYRHSAPATGQYERQQDEYQEHPTDDDMRQRQAARSGGRHHEQNEKLDRQHQAQQLLPQSSPPDSRYLDDARMPGPRPRLGNLDHGFARTLLVGVWRRRFALQREWNAFRSTDWSSTPAAKRANAQTIPWYRNGRV